MNMHAGIYAYPCKFCGKGFSDSKNLKEHLPLHTNINYFHCRLCGEQFRYHWKMKFHMSKEHGTQQGSAS
jgi:uncharacterized Zn-finger protein